MIFRFAVVLPGGGALRENVRLASNSGGSKLAKLFAQAIEDDSLPIPSAHCFDRAPFVRVSTAKRPIRSKQVKAEA